MGEIGLVDRWLGLHNFVIGCLVTIRVVEFQGFAIALKVVRGVVSERFQLSCEVVQPVRFEC